jgi:hypothetical protein
MSSRVKREDFAMIAIDHDNRAANETPPAKSESKMFVYLFALTAVGIVGIALYQFFGCATCY